MGRTIWSPWDSAQSPLPPRAGAPHLRSVRKLLLRHSPESLHQSLRKSPPASNSFSSTCQSSTLNDCSSMSPLLQHSWSQFILSTGGGALAGVIRVLTLLHTHKNFHPKWRAVRPDLPNPYTVACIFLHTIHGHCHPNLKLRQRSHFLPRNGNLSNFSILVTEFKHEKPRPVGDKALEQMDLQFQYINSNPARLRETAWVLLHSKRRNRTWMRYQVVSCKEHLSSIIPCRQLMHP